MPSCPTGRSRAGPSIRTPSSRLERPTFGNPSVSAFIARNIGSGTGRFAADPSGERPVIVPVSKFSNPSGVACRRLFISHWDRFFTVGARTGARARKRSGKTCPAMNSFLHQTGATTTRSRSMRPALRYGHGSCSWDSNVEGSTAMRDWRI